MEGKSRNREWSSPLSRWKTVQILVQKRDQWLQARWLSEEMCQLPAAGKWGSDRGRGGDDDLD